MSQINIGLVGFGTIGGGVISLLNENKDLIKKRSGIDFEIKKIVDVDLEKLKKLQGISSSKRYQDILEDDNIDIVLELAGGVDFPYQLFNETMNAGKHFVTANKALLSKHMSSIFDLAKEKEKYIGFEASVAGGIPIIKTLRNSLVGNKIISIEGIINGTTNYILTQMEEKNINFNSALKKAQELGLAEADPTLDINGDDAASKIAILATLAFNQNINREDVYMKGIEDIELLDIQYAKELGYRVKLIAISRKCCSGEVEIRVHPSFVGEKNPLSDVKNEFNAVLIDSDFLGSSMYYGKGAGARPTASSVISDIVEIGTKIVMKKEYNKEALNITEEKKIKLISKTKSKYYIRIMTKDEPGILSKIATVLGNNNISIASVIQKDVGKQFIPMVFTTHEANEENFNKSINAIESFDFVDKVTYYRIID